MKLIIAGSRHLNIPTEMVTWIVDQFPQIYDIGYIISGKAKGIDTCGENYAWRNQIPVLPFPVTKTEWAYLGPKAGPLRNRKMAAEADALLLIWDGTSPGSKNMKAEMEKLGKPVFEYIIKKVYNE